jgi:chitinase
MWLIALFFLFLLVIGLLFWAGSRSKNACHAYRRRRHRHPSSSPSSPSVYIPPPGGLLGSDVPVKAVYLGYSQGVSSIDITVRAAADAGFNLIVLAFWMGPEIGTDPFSAASYWQQLSSSARTAAIEQAHSVGARVIISAGGAGYQSYPINGGAAFGSGAAAFALQYDLDGVDFDFENLTTAFGTPSGMDKAATLAWMRDANSAARASLGSGRLITHAPQAPYFNVEFAFGYRDFIIAAPQPSVDLLLIQYYNQGMTYLTYNTQFIDNSSFHPDTTIRDLILATIPASKLVIGRLTQARDGDAATWIDPATLGAWFVQAASDPQVNNWKTGFSTWQWHQNGDGSPSSPEFLHAVYP